MKKPTKRIAVVDADVLMVDSILAMVADRYDFEFTSDRDADYVFHSVAGMDVLKYPGVRIFVTGENVSPNFGISDYAMAFDQLEFGDRYIWLPLLKLYREAYASLTSPRPPVQSCVQKPHFCAYVMSNTKNSAPERIRIVDLLDQYRTVHCGGRWRNNTGKPVSDKLAFQRDHKFVIAFENTSWRGYLTEKFAEAAQANAVPIYWGDPGAGKIFNPKAFVDCHRFSSFEAVVQEIKRIDSDENIYSQYLSEPWFPDGIEPLCLRNETYAAFLANIFDQDLDKAYRRNRGRWGLKHERRLYDMSHRPWLHAMHLLRKRWKGLRRAISKPTSR